jgi:multicomponent Na+:H+ antiporter subunit G
MMNEQLSAGLLLIGATFMLLAGIGVLRLPDIFMRLQAGTKASTLGIACILLGAALHFQDIAVTVRAVLIIGFFCLTAPIGAHMIARAAYAVGAPLWEGSITDELAEYRKTSKLTEQDVPTADGESEKA